MSSNPADMPAAKDTPKKGRWLIEYGPLILFFIVNYSTGILWATAALVLATVIALTLSWVLDRHIPMMTLLGGIAVTFFGGLTWVLDDPFYIKIKPTVISLLIAVILIGGQLAGRNPLKAMLGSKLQLSDTGWRQVTWMWAAMFATSAGANELAWRMLSDDGWVTFKLFGLTGISVVFAMLTIPIMSRHSLVDLSAAASSDTSKD
ncbi:Intracellular septation protein A [SAR116 cluster alpha proteobacterium HIMB100]|nr:Intracellular septation protein A [SAR116 cluster alpha proteobacterium HIMB100]